MRDHAPKRPDGSATPSRALVVPTPAPTDAPAGDGRTAPTSRPLASFVTQLLACEARLPPYRNRRRASPEAATSAYGAREGRGAEASGRALPGARRARCDRAF